MERKLAKYLTLISLIFFTSQIFSQSQIKLLERAYEEDSDSLMQIFFENWKQMTPYNYNNYSDANDTVKAIKEIYKSFYDSLDFFKNNKINLLPNDIKYNVVNYINYFQWYLDSNLNEFEKDNLRRDTLPCPEIIINAISEKVLYTQRIKNFRPNISNEKILFLDSLFCGRINTFLIGNFRKEPWANLSQDLSIRPDKFLARYNFLKSYWSLQQSGERIYDKNKIYFYNKFVDLYSKNTIYNIYIDKSLNYCIVKSEDANCTDYYYMSKTNNGWKIKRKGGICWCN